ncbi:hypothetical protein [Micromonospora sp. NPDC051141]|uniref:hypothetical protein n=1 Tax=Micromonospora sp. NPDC051141 TaxID=3364284 RepID=UPI0037BCA21E
MSSPEQAVNPNSETLPSRGSEVALGGSRRRAAPRAVRSRRALMIGLGVTVLALGGCAGTSDPRPSPPSASPATAGGAATARAVATYRSNDALCAQLDWRAFSDRYGPADRQPQQTRTLGATTDLICTATLGRLPDGVVVIVRASVGAPQSGQVMYEGLRRAHGDTASLQDVPAVGAGAYRYADAGGSHLVAYDANLYLTVTAAPLRLNATAPADLAEPLSRTATAALSALHA